MTWILREVKVRYRQSLLGIAWAIFQPLSLMVVYTVIFARLSPSPHRWRTVSRFRVRDAASLDIFRDRSKQRTSSLVNNLAS